MLKRLEDLLEAVRAIDAELYVPQESVKVHGSDLDAIVEVMENLGIVYWLYDEPRANPEMEYELWICREDHYGGSSTFSWGLARV